MASLRVSLQVDLDGVPATWLAPNGRIVRRYEVDESIAFNYTKADDGNATTFTTVPDGTQLDTVQVLLLVPEGEMTFRLDGQTDAGITIGANGVLLALGATIDASAATNCKVNLDDTAANLKGILAGT